MVSYYRMIDVSNAVVIEVAVTKGMNKYLKVVAVEPRHLKEQTILQMSMTVLLAKN